MLCEITYGFLVVTTNFSLSLSFTGTTVLGLDTCPNRRENLTIISFAYGHTRAHTHACIHTGLGLTNGILLEDNVMHEHGQVRFHTEK